VRTKGNEVTQDLMAAKESLGAKPKDDSDAVVTRELLELGAKVDFAANNFWRRNDDDVNEADLEEMLRDEGWK
jgi:hypothetical protein